MTQGISSLKFVTQFSPELELFSEQRKLPTLIRIIGSISSRTCHSQCLNNLDGIVDMLLDMGIPDLPNGVNETQGMCGTQRNAYQKYKAPAYAIHKGAMITVATSEVSRRMSDQQSVLKFLISDFL